VEEKRGIVPGIRSLRERKVTPSAIAGKSRGTDVMEAAPVEGGLKAAKSKNGGHIQLIP